MIALTKVRHHGLVQMSIKKDKITSLRGNDGGVPVHPELLKRFDGRLEHGGVKSNEREDEVGSISILSRSLCRHHVLTTFLSPVLGALMKQVCWHPKRSPRSTKACPRPGLGHKTCWLMDGESIIGLLGSHSND